MVTSNKSVCVIGVPMNLGSSRLGPKYGPEHLREIIANERIFAHRGLSDRGNIVMPAPTSNPGIASLPFICEANGELRSLIASCFDEPDVVALILGGDHSVSWGSITATVAQHPDAAVIYLDAHGDFNTAETSPSQHIHGMHMAYLMGAGRTPLWKPGDDILAPERTLFLGTRSLDPGEVALAKELNLNIRTARQIRTHGMEGTFSELHDFLQRRNPSAIHLSIDIDVLDPEVAPGTGVPEADGLTINELNTILAWVLKTGRVAVIDLVEFNPRLDKEDLTRSACSAILKTIDAFLV